MRHRIALAVARLVLIVSGAYLLAPYANDHPWPFIGGVLLLGLGWAIIGYEYHADRVSDAEARLLRLQIIDMRESIEARRRNQENDE